MNFRSIQLKPSAVAASAAIALLVTACGLRPVGGALAAGEEWQKTCPETSLASSMHIDVSGTYATKKLGSDTKRALHDLAARTAVCGGHLRVTAFAGSSAQAFALFDGTISLPGATDNARWRRLPDAVDDVVGTTTRSYEKVVSNGPYNGSDIVAQLRLADEFGRQIGSNTWLDVLVMTDGFQSVAANPTSLSTSGQAAQFADELPVPVLRGEILFAGLGNRTDGTAVSSATVELLKAFYERICERTGVSKCAAVTDYQSKIGTGS